MIPFDPPERTQTDFAAAAKPMRPPSIDDIIVKVAPDPAMAPPTEADTKRANQQALRQNWNTLTSPYTQTLARLYYGSNGALGLSGVLLAASGGYYSMLKPEIFAQNSALNKAIEDVGAVDAPLANTSKVVLDIRDIPAGDTCWKKYTSAQTAEGTVQSTALAQCLNTERGALNDQLAAPGISLCIALMLCACGGIIRLQLTNEQKQYKQIRRDILNNPEYNGQPLPGPLKRTQPTLQLDKD